MGFTRGAGIYVLVVLGLASCTGSGAGPSDAEPLPGEGSGGKTHSGGGSGGSAPALGGSASGGARSGGARSGGASSGGASDSVGGGGGDAPSRLTMDCSVFELEPRAGRTILVEAGSPGKVRVNGSETTLREVIQSTEPGDTVSLADGTYTFDEAESGSYTGLYVTTPDITIEGASRDPSKVILDSNYADHGEQTAAISVDAPRVWLSHFTVRRSIFHLVHLWENADETRLYDLVLEDGGQQFVKASPGEGLVEGAEVACSRFVMTDEGRREVWGYGEQDGSTRCYTGGIDTHNAANWHVHDNFFSGIHCDTAPGRPAHGKKSADRDGQTYAGGLAEHAVHMWDSPEGTSHLIERNHIVDCARGIGIGMSDLVYGSIVRNNVVQSSFAQSEEHDVPINVERGQGTLVAFNTVYNDVPLAYPSSIEIRWAESAGVTVHGNLLTGVLSARDGALPTAEDNVEGAIADEFADPAAHDLRPKACGLLPSVAALETVLDDAAGTPRRSAPTVGAYECE